MSSGEVLRVIGTYKKLGMTGRPSELMGIDDAYTAFCFDEACAYIITRIENKEKPIIKAGDKENRLKRPSDLYGKYEK